MAEQINWEKKDSLEDVKIILAKILRKWYWVVLALIMAISGAFLYIRYQDEIFVVNASFISRKFDARGASVVSIVSDADRFTERIEVNQQIPLLKSEKRIIETLQRLDFDVSYMVEGRVKAAELYKVNPYKVLTLDSSSYIPYNQDIYLKAENKQSYTLNSSNEQLNKQFIGNTYLFNVNQNIRGWQFKIVHDNGNGLNPEHDYYFTIHQPRGLMSNYRSMLNINWAYKNSAILNASINSKIPEKDFDFLETYLQVVIDLGLEERNEYLVKTIDFIDGYMEDINDTLLNYQGRIDDFRLSNRNVISGSSLVINKLNKLDDTKAQIALENSYYEYIENYIRENRSESIFAPNLIGLQVPPLEELVGQYMGEKWTDQLDRNEDNEKNPLVARSNEQSERLEDNIYESVKNLKELNREKVSEIDKRINFFIQSISDLQVEYRAYTNMDRMKILYENLHNQLLARKTDAYITMASATSDYQLVTAPYYSRIPIYPNKNKIYIISILLGLGFPIGLIFLFDFINPKIVSKEDLQKHSDIPIIGSVGHFKGKTNLAVDKQPKSQVAESFRVIRANLEFLDSENEEAKVILITSSISGEGKTFCSTNLAYTYANMGRKTLLIGADMRRPALARNFSLEKQMGLSNFLSGQCPIEEIFYNSNNKQLDVIPGGHVPPNPAELLTTKRMDELMTFVRKEYEVVVFDTPPIGLVSDTIELAKLSLTPLLIVRQDVTYKKSLDAISEMYHAGKYKNLGIVMNDINYTRFDYGTYYGRSYGYGSGFGYGYYDDEHKRSLWKRLFRS